jgi:hypothetical protein
MSRKILSIAVGGVVLILAGGVRAQDPMRISVTRKTAASRKGDQQSLPRGSAQVSETDSFYRFEIRRVRLDVPEDLRIRHMTIVQLPNGSLRAAAVKEEEFVLAGPTAAVVDAEPVTLRTVHWTAGPPGYRSSGDLKEKLYGWHARILDDNGNILMEKCHPKDVETQAERLAGEWERDAARGDIGGPGPMRRPPFGDDPDAPPPRRPGFPFRPR